jgi:hypothetical protein
MTGTDQENELDAFISHASEDKGEIVRPLAQELQKKGLRVWFDEFELTVGDSLTESIDKGLTTSRYGIVILSKSFFDKNWPEYELRGLKQRQLNSERNVILPLWYGIDKNDIVNYSPTLADIMAQKINENNITEVSNTLVSIINDRPVDSNDFNITARETKAMLHTLIHDLDEEYGLGPLGHIEAFYGHYEEEVKESISGLESVNKRDSYDEVEMLAGAIESSLGETFGELMMNSPLDYGQARRYLALRALADRMIETTKDQDEYPLVYKKLYE